ncbi:TPA: hypothetical protein ACH3X1_014069 [Trebouxia sp. C0004]
MAEATPATAVPNARLSGSKRKKVPGSSSPNWDSYLHKVLQDNHPGVKITKEAMQVWAEALDAWLQQLAQEIVQEHTSQALTPQNVRASLELLLAKGESDTGFRVAHQGRNSKCHAARLDNPYQAALTVRSSVNTNCTPLHSS